jgi:hypothetical protein
MARLASGEIFNEVVSTTASMFTAAEYNEILGRSDQIAFQFHVTGATGSSPALSVVLWGSNDGKNWVSQLVLVNNQSLTVGGVYDSIVDTGSVVLASRLKLEVKLGGVTPSAYVQITWCGRGT